MVNVTWAFGDGSLTSGHQGCRDVQLRFAQKHISAKLNTSLQQSELSQFNNPGKKSLLICVESDMVCCWPCLHACVDMKDLVEIAHNRQINQGFVVLSSGNTISPHFQMNIL